MKLGIITRHAISNYGSILQSYATQKYFDSLGIENEIINYIPEEETKNNITNSLLKNSCTWNRNIFSRLLYRIIQGINYKLSYKYFEKFRHEILKTSKVEYNSFNDLLDVNSNYDSFCVGSDQVWGKMQISDANKRAYYLGFCNHEKKIFSFSSSIGSDNLSDDKKQFLKDNLNSFSSILVREKSAESILKSVGLKNVYTILDPTLLFGRENWDCFEGKRGRLLPKDYILVYQLHSNKQFDKYVKRIEKELNLPVYRICPSSQNLFRYGKPLYLKSPRDFLNYIKYSSFFITDSFHGTVFSIIFNKKFNIVMPSNKTGTRILCLLNDLDIKDVIVKEINDFRHWNNDYSIINVRLNERVCESNNLIEKELERIGMYNGKQK